MGKNDKKIIEIFFIIINALLICVFTYLFMKRYVIFEVFLALVFALILADAFILFLYWIHKRFKKIADALGFEFITRFLEQPRMEGMYNKNWFQIHFTSRNYSEYWGMPRTYIKLQFKDNRKYDEKKLKKYDNYKLNGLNITNIQHIIRPYKNYILMRVDWYVMEKENLARLMDFLIRIEKEAKLK